MKLRKIMSGGQTGADRTGLECARDRGFATGGWVPQGCRTDVGDDPTLLDFGCTETISRGYKTRTHLNTRDSHITVWFGNTNSPGFFCTQNGCKEYGRKMVDNPTLGEFRFICETYEVVNIAGNRESSNPGVVDLVRAAFAGLPERDPGDTFVPIMGD